MAKIKRSLLKDIKKAARAIKNQEAQENKQENKPSFKAQLSHDQKRQIRKESFNDHKVKVTWNIHPGDLVKIKNHKGKLKVAVVLTKSTRTNHYANEDREYVTVATPENSHYEVNPKRLEVIQRISK